MPPRPAIALFAVPLLLLAAATILIRACDLDLAWTTPFYDPGTASWPWQDRQPWRALYKFGFLPAWAVAIAGGTIFVAGFFSSRLRRLRRMGLFLFLVLVIGPGFIVNAIFKDHWGRPRPREIERFGGPQPFEAVLTIDPASNGKSFPSGHASMGFYFMSLAFVLRSFAKRILAILAGAGGFAYGCLMGLGRVMQGGHFPSDILWSAGFVFLTAAGLYYATGLARKASSPLSTR